MKRMMCAFVGVFLIAIVVMMQVAGKDIDKTGYIKYVEFNVTSEALKDAVNLDIESQDSDNKVDFITLLAYLGAKYGGDFSKYSRSDMTEFADKIKEVVAGLSVATETAYAGFP